ncbi:MAG: sugar nucleotide-binding protein, partial [Bacteroidota bacterium]
MKLLIIGAGTIAGHSLLRIFPRESAAELLFAYDSRDTISPLAGIDHRIIDLIDKKQVKTLCNEFRPDVIINTAGWHDIDKCERQKQFCWQMNTALPETLARISVINECRLICHSTDMIFPGSEAPYSEEARPS